MRNQATTRPAIRIRHSGRILAILIATFVLLHPDSSTAYTLSAQPVDSPDSAVYLDQVQGVLSDARSNLDAVDYYLPLGSLKDQYDPTWDLVAQAATSLGQDAQALKTLSPPPALADLNAVLLDSITQIADAASAAADALSRGDVRQGRLAELRLNDAETLFSQGLAELSPKLANPIGTADPAPPQALP
jgi:hypothetical protein